MLDTTVGAIEIKENLLKLCSLGNHIQTVPSKVELGMVNYQGSYSFYYECMSYWYLLVDGHLEKLLKYNHGTFSYNWESVIDLSIIHLFNKYLLIFFL